MKFNALFQLSFVALLMFALTSCSTDGQKNRTMDMSMEMMKKKTSPLKIDPETPGFNTEEYDKITDNEFQDVTKRPLSTFSIDVDNASYSNTRRFLTQGQLPPKDAVRTEEFINYFVYDYKEPSDEHPFTVHTEVSDCPWSPEHKLLHIGMKGMEVAKDKMPPSNLVFLIDVSGSMSAPEKLPLLKNAFRLLVKEMRPEDRVAIVTYAGSDAVVLPSTAGSSKRAIKMVIDQMESGGSTAGAAGIKTAYKIALQNLIKDGNNRVILATDGDFNVGTSSDAELVRLIEKRRNQGVFLSVLGFGMGNYKDSKMEKLADNGNGNYFYIDNITEARKVLVTEMTNTLYTIAKDVKLQLEFNPKQVKEYRLVGYENRLLNDEDFNNDAKDAGDMGAGHTVTALYEVIPADSDKTMAGNIDKLKYQEVKTTNAAAGDELVTIKMRYKAPDGDVSKMFKTTATDTGLKLDETSDNFRFSASVASFGMLLRDSKFKGQMDYAKAADLARNSKGEDKFGYRSEFIRLIELAETFSGERHTAEN